MSSRNSTAADEGRNRQKHGKSVASIVSTASSTANLTPFEGLTDDEVTFIESIINRVPSSATTFVPVFKAYQDEFEERDLNASDDQFYYNLLLKLGMIRADNWQGRWRLVKEHFEYQLGSPLQSNVLPEAKEDQPRASSYHPPFDNDDDAFTLHSHAESVGDAVPPSYTAKARKLFEGATAASAVQGSSSGPLRLRTNHPTAPSTHVSRRRLASATTHSEQEGESQADKPSPTAAVPPSYHTFPQVAPERPIRSPAVTRDDAQTWKTIEMEHDADLFRREFLLSRCLNIWVQGLRWVETTTTRLDNARTEFILRSVLARWREKSAAAMAESKRSAAMDRVRLLSSSLSKWRLRTWTLRRKRWADEMRGRMVGMQNKVARRQLSDFFAVWRRSYHLVVSIRQHELFIMQRTLEKWNRRLYHVAELSHQGDQLTKQANMLLLERALEAWRRQAQYNAAVRIIRERGSDRVKWNALKIWHQRTHVQSVACGFSEARILRNALQTWIRRRMKLKQLERRAIAHQNKPLVRAVIHIWIARMREQRYAQANDHRVLAGAMRKWTRHLEANRDKGHHALIIAARIDQRLLQRYLRTWAQRLEADRRLQRRAQKAYEVTLNMKVLIQWRTKIKAHSKAMREAKLVHKLFLERIVWKRWREKAEQRYREKKLETVTKNQMRQVLQVWVSKTKSRRALRRKAEVVMMALQTRVLKVALERWTLRVVSLKDREFCVLQERRDKVLRHYFLRWKRAIDQQNENTSLMMSFRDVRREETMRRVLNHWFYATRRKQSLAEREEEFSRSLVSQAFEKWRDRFLENSLREVELDVLLQSQTNLLFRAFRIWESRTPLIPALRFHAQHTRARFWRKWKAEMPGAMKRKQAREHDQRVLLGRAFSRWREKYKSKISLKAIARARYLRLPPVQAKPTTLRLPSKSVVGPRSDRSISPDRGPPRRPLSALYVPPEANRAPSPTSTRASFQGLGGLARRRPTLTGASSISAGSRGSQDGRRDSRQSWDGIGATRARARAAFSAGFSRPTSLYQESKDDEDSESS